MQAVFDRSLSSLEEIFSFTERFFDAEEVEPGPRYAVNLVIEELFTNMVKFNPDGPATVTVQIERLPAALQVCLSDREPEPFDVSEPRELDIDAPVERRDEGGMGLFLVQKFVDALEYAYRDGISTITFVKKLGQEDA